MVCAGSVEPRASTLIVGLPPMPFSLLFGTIDPEEGGTKSSGPFSPTTAGIPGIRLSVPSAKKPCSNVLRNPPEALPSPAPAPPAGDAPDPIRFPKNDPEPKSLPPNRLLIKFESFAELMRLLKGLKPFDPLPGLPGPPAEPFLSFETT